MKQYILQTDWQGLKKNDKLLPVPNYAEPVPYASEAELAKPTPANFFFLSFLTSHPEIFKEVNE